MGDPAKAKAIDLVGRLLKLERERWALHCEEIARSIEGGQVPRPLSAEQALRGLAKVLRQATDEDLDLEATEPRL